MIKKNTLLISIFTHDRNEALAVNLAGLYNQTYKDFSILIVDDFSKEPPEADPLIRIFLDRLGADGINVEFYRSKTNNGIAKNRALIIDKLKKFDFVMDLNDDHYMEPPCIEHLMRTLSRSDVVAVGSATPMFFWPQEKLFKKYDPTKPFNSVWENSGELFLSRGVDYIYTDEKGDVLTYPIELAHISQFMYKSKYLKFLPKNMSLLGFTEETFLSLELKKNSGLKLLFQPNAVNWHMQYKKGGIRAIPHSKWEKMMQADWRIFKDYWLDWVKENQKSWLR